MTDLGHREVRLLRSLDDQQQGRASSPCCLTPDEFTSVVLGLRSRGLCGADVRPVCDDLDAGTVYFVDRVWLTVEGRGLVQSLDQQ